MSIAYLRGVRGCRDLEILRRKAMLLSAFQDDELLEERLGRAI
jgi:hypothetical protein